MLGSVSAISALIAAARAGTITPPARAIALMATPPPATPPRSSAAAPATSADPPEDAEDVIIQAVVVRRDLLKTMEWPVGSVIAQACHACLAVAWEHRDDPCVADYLAAGNIDSMHKVVKECKGEAQVRVARRSFASPSAQRHASSLVHSSTRSPRGLSKRAWRTRFGSNSPKASQRPSRSNPTQKAWSARCSKSTAFSSERCYTYTLILYGVRLLRP